MGVKPAPITNSAIKMRHTTRRDWVESIKGVNDG